MAVMKGVNPTKGNPRPAAKPPTAKPLVPAKPLVAAGTGGMGSERNALKRSNPITTPTQMLKPGTRLPLTPNQGSRLYNPSVGAPPVGPVKLPPPPPRVPLGTPGTIPPALGGLNAAWNGFSSGIQTGAQDFWAQILQGISELPGPDKNNPLKRQ